MPAPEFCHCGLPLHYENYAIKDFVCALVAMKGEFVPCRAADGRWWNVQRHYIALHGFKEQELHTLGFEEITQTRNKT